MADSMHTRPLEEKLSDNTANLLKAAIPYVQPPQARALALTAKFLEFKKTLICFSDDNELSICSVSGKRPSPEEMLCDLRKYCDSSQAEAIDKMLGMLKMGKLYEKYQELASSPEFSKILNSLGALGGDINQTAAQTDGAIHAQAKNPGFDAAAFMQNFQKSPEMENTLKSMLTPQQLAMFEQLKASMQQHS